MALRARDPAWYLATVLLVAGCAGSSQPMLPTGIAQLMLRQDAATLRRIGAADRVARDRSGLGELRVHELPARPGTRPADGAAATGDAAGRGGGEGLRR